VDFALFRQNPVNDALYFIRAHRLMILATFSKPRFVK
jgi:hypothetical protein